jgi:ArsR family transcriptional regulator
MPDINKELPIAKATVSQYLSELKDVGVIRGDIDLPKLLYRQGKLAQSYETI